MCEGLVSIYGAHSSPSCQSEGLSRGVAFTASCRAVYVSVDSFQCPPIATFSCPHVQASGL